MIVDRWDRLEYIESRHHQSRLVFEPIESLEVEVQIEDIFLSKKQRYFQDLLQQMQRKEETQHH